MRSGSSRLLLIDESRRLQGATADPIPGDPEENMVWRKSRDPIEESGWRHSLTPGTRPLLRQIQRRRSTRRLPASGPENPAIAVRSGSTELALLDLSIPCRETVADLLRASTVARAGVVANIVQKAGYQALSRICAGVAAHAVDAIQLPVNRERAPGCRLSDSGLGTLGLCDSGFDSSIWTPVARDLT